MELDVIGWMSEWRGPAPYWFLPISDDDSAMIDELKPMLTYGWGCIPVTCRLGRTEFTTSIMPRNRGRLYRAANICHDTPYRPGVSRPLDELGVRNRARWRNCRSRTAG